MTSQNLKNQLRHMAPTLDVDQLMVLFNDPEELGKHQIKSVPIRNVAEMFHMELPYAEIKALVMAEKELIFSTLKTDGKSPTFEHVGSTSINGMPGMTIPDVLLIEESFPPARSTIEALVQCGWFFHCLAPLDDKDLFFIKHVENGPCEVIAMHLMGAENKLGKLLVKMRDLCNSDKEAFDDYKQSKIAAALGQGDADFAT